MSSIHYLQEISRFKKRISLFAGELPIKDSNAENSDMNSAQNRRFLMRIVGELHAIKACTVVRCNQHFYMLYDKNRPLAKMLFVRSVKERFFLKQLAAELEKFGRTPEFRATVKTCSEADDAYPASMSEKVLREHYAVHSMLVECYLELLAQLKKTNADTRIIWILNSMLIMEQKYALTEKNHFQHLAA